MKRYDIYYVRLDPSEGSEMAKTRPAVIVSLDILNGLLPTVVVCPLTSRQRPTWRSRLQVKVANRNADVCVEQIRTVSKLRLGKRIASLSAGDAKTLRLLISEMYGEP